MASIDPRSLRMLTTMGIDVWVPRDVAHAAPTFDVPTFDAPRFDAPTVDASTLDRPTTEVAPSTTRRAHITALDWPALEREVAACVACGLCKTRKRTVFGVGSPRAPWMLIGEAPGAEEDARGEPFVGQAGRLLDAMLASLSMARGEDAFIANVLKCRPPGNRDPQPDEVETCAPFLERQIALVAPQLIVLLGRFAAQTVLGTDASIAKLRGTVHRIEREGRSVPVVVTYHPAYLLRNLADKAKAWADWNLALDTWRAQRAA